MLLFPEGGFLTDEVFPAVGFEVGFVVLLPFFGEDFAVFLSLATVVFATGLVVAFPGDPSAVVLAVFTDIPGSCIPAFSDGLVDLPFGVGRFEGVITSFVPGFDLVFPPILSAGFGLRVPEVLRARLRFDSSGSDN